MSTGNISVALRPAGLGLAPHGRVGRHVMAWVLAMGCMAVPAVSLAQAAPAPAGDAAAAPSAAQAAPAVRPAGPPPGFAAPALPGEKDSAAERSRSQPGNNAPIWREVRSTGTQPGTTNMRALESGTLIQGFTQYPGSQFTTAGEAWRQVRNQWLLPYGGALLVIVALAIGLFYWRRGSLGGHVPDTGRRIERFTPFERAAHWTNAGAFTVLAISGIVMAFGKFFLLPVIGGTLFGWLTYALKTAHNFVGPLFAVSLLVVIFTFIKDNLPAKGDLTWLLKGGGLFGGEEVPSHRFNAGEKVLFWIFMLGAGLVVVASGLVLDKVLPVVEYSRGNMQVAHLVHGVATVLMMAALAGHIYMGTLGMKGAFQAMRTGYVDEGWAQEHHGLWHQDVKAGRIPAQRSTPPGASLPGTPGAHA